MEKLKIYIDRLKDGNKIKIEEKISPAIFEIEEEDLSMKEEVSLTGEAYLANDDLVLHLNILTKAQMPCAICNATIDLPIAINDLYLTKPLNEIQGAAYDITEEVRESALLQLPLFAECEEGNCPERENLKKFLQSSETKEKTTKSKDVIHFPFADL